MRLNNYKNCIISTVDHPYVSPPMRLLDSHLALYELSKKTKVIVMNWDVSLPNERTYKYDLQIDIPIVGRRDELFLLKDESTPFALQNINKPNLIEYKNELYHAAAFYSKNRQLSDESIHKMYKNFEELSNKIFFKMSDNQYSRLSIIEMYRILNNDELANFISKSYYYFYNSKIMTEDIPDLIDSVNDKKSIYNLMKKGIFTRRTFRDFSQQINEDINNPEYFKNNKNEITNLIRSGQIIPSTEVLYWAMEAFGIYHFGNDLGFFERYSSYLGVRLNNQITQKNEDGIQYFKLARDFGLTKNGQVLSFKKKFNESKQSRINSLFGIYILIGQDMKHFETGKTKTVNIINGEFKLSSA